MAPSIRLKPNATARVLQGHPWVFANEIKELLPAELDGGTVECRDARGRFLGTGIYNSKSQIAWRRLSRDRVELDESYLRGALERAVQRRGAGLLRPVMSQEPAVGAASPRPYKESIFRRLVWSEADDLPGVVADQYGETLVLQIQTLAMDKCSVLIGNLLVELTGAEEVIYRNDSNLRKLEGLPAEVRPRSGKPWEPRWLMIDGLEYWIDLQGGQKTGFYLDQRLQHTVVARYAAGRRMLDAFCNQGSFALHGARAGATEVRGLDSAEDAVAAARRNAGRNGLRAEFLVANLFRYFTEKRHETRGLVVLDPPPFARSKGALEGALRGYKEINLRAMQRLTPGGILATYSCSHHVRDAEFREMLASAAADAKRRVHIVEFCHQPPDHPVLVTMPESEYLRGCILRVE